MFQALCLQILQSQGGNTDSWSGVVCLCELGDTAREFNTPFRRFPYFRSGMFTQGRSDDFPEYKQISKAWRDRTRGNGLKLTEVKVRLALREEFFMMRVGRPSRSCGCPTPGNVPSQDGQGPEQPDIVSGIPARGRRLELGDLIMPLPSQTFSGFCKIQALLHEFPQSPFSHLRWRMNRRQPTSKQRGSREPWLLVCYLFPPPGWDPTPSKPPPLHSIPQLAKKITSYICWFMGAAAPWGGRNGITSISTLNWTLSWHKLT